MRSKLVWSLAVYGSGTSGCQAPIKEKKKLFRWAANWHPLQNNTFCFIRVNFTCVFDCIVLVVMMREGMGIVPYKIPLQEKGRIYPWYFPKFVACVFTNFSHCTVSLWAYLKVLALLCGGGIKGERQSFLENKRKNIFVLFCLRWRFYFYFTVLFFCLSLMKAIIHVHVDLDTYSTV